jgi:Ca2+/H+ antiporter, TMEM165/GDT1 family
MSAWIHAGPSVLAAFLASLVECVEALTIVLAVGSTRGWRGALSGSAAALVLLVAIVSVFGSALSRIPIAPMQVVVGALLVTFGLRWLRKAILRAAGVIPLHDEGAAFANEKRRLGNAGNLPGWDKVAFATSFQITMLEGAEVVFIILGIGAGGTGLMIAAGIGALAALFVVIAIALAVHRPLASVPENLLKFIVGILLSSFGTFWFGEGAGMLWPGADWSLVGLALSYLAAAVVAVRLCRGARQKDAPAIGSRSI